jgi:kinesin family protein C2/C3
MPVQQWLIFPNEWRAWIPSTASDAYRGEAELEAEDPNTMLSEPLLEEDPRMGFFDHPTRGRLQTYMFENSRNTRLYFDAAEQDWNRIPLFWECNVTEVREMLEAIDQALPTWGNVNEQLLVLRECNYVVDVCYPGVC